MFFLKKSVSSRVFDLGQFYLCIGALDIRTHVPMPSKREQGMHANRQNRGPNPGVPYNRVISANRQSSCTNMTVLIETVN